MPSEPCDDDVQTPARLFVSYGRGDDEAFVRRLVADLQPAVAVWWDRQAMESRGQTFLQVIRDAIATECSALLLVVGPEAMRSDYVKAEWMHALAYCKVVVPIVRLGDPTLLPQALKDAGYNLIPQELAAFHAPDFRDDTHYERSLAELRRILASAPRIAGPTRGLPAEAAHFLARPDLVDALRGDLLADVVRPVAIGAAQQTAALQGMGGIGKSVLAAAIARDCRIRRAFHDGVVWLAFGHRAEALVEQARRLGDGLGDPALAGLREVAILASRLDDALRTRACLVVLDDVWSTDQAAPFVRAAASTRSRVLLTTRDAAIVRALDAHEHRVGLLSNEEALRLLARAAHIDMTDLPPLAQALADECGRLPLALAIVGAMVRGRANDRWTDTLEHLRRADLDRLRADFPDYREYPHLMAVIGASVEALPAATAAAYLDLAMLADDERIPEAVLQQLWAVAEVDAAAVRARIDLLADRALLDRDERGWIGVHDIQHDFLVHRCPDVTSVRRRLVAAYRAACADDWPALADDGYVYAHLVRLLAATGAAGEVHRLLEAEKGGAPAWHAVRARAGQVAGFRDDVVAARGLAAAASVDALNAGRDADALPLLIGHALVQSSLSSLGVGLPPELWVAAVRDGLIDPAHALDAASTLAQLEPSALYRKCEVLLALAAVLPGVLADAAFVAALAAIEQAIDGRINEDRWVAGPLALVVPCAPAAAIERAAALAARFDDPLAREQVMGAVAVRWLALGQAPRAFDAAAAVTHGAGPGYVVREMAAVSSTVDWPQVARAHGVLATAEQRRVATATVAAATARHESAAAALAFVARLADDDEANDSYAALAPELDGDDARVALTALVGRSGDLVHRVAAEAVLALRLPDDERDARLDRLWRDTFDGYTKDHEQSQCDLLDRVPPRHWPAAAVAQLHDDPKSFDYLEASDCLAEGLAMRGDAKVLLDWIGRELHGESPSRATSLIAAAAPAADVSLLESLAALAQGIVDARQREIAEAAVIGRRAALGHAAAAWQQLQALHDDYVRSKALRLVVPQLHGAAIEPALRQLGRIGDADEAEMLRTGLAAACDLTPAALVEAIAAGRFSDEQVAAQLCLRVSVHGEEIDELLTWLRRLHDDHARADAQLALAVLPGHESEVAFAEAMLSITNADDMERQARRFVPQLPRLKGMVADAMRQRFATAAQAWFDSVWSGSQASVRVTAATLLAWCSGVGALAPALAEASRDDNPFGRAYALRIARLPFLPHAERAAAAAELVDLIEGAPNPYDTLIRTGVLEQLPVELLPPLRRVLERRCDFDAVRSEVAELAVRAAALGDVVFADAVATRLAPVRPEASVAVRVALLAHTTDAGTRAGIARVAAYAAVRVINPVNQVRKRSDTLATLVPALLTLPRATAASILEEMLAALADAPRAHLLLDLASLAPLLVALGGSGVDTTVVDAADRVRRWWP
ncbi:MAG: NB-ARC domain-containing protein [Burkholderiaceae bacterium]